MRTEREALDRLAEGVGRGGRGAAGIAEVLDALNQARVETLLISENFRAAGRVDFQAGLLLPEEANTGEPVDDIVEPAIEKAIEQSANAMVVRHHDDLAPLGGIGALLTILSRSARHRRLPERLHAGRRARGPGRRRDRREDQRARRLGRLRPDRRHPRLASAGPRLVRRPGRAVARALRRATARARSCTRHWTRPRSTSIVDKGQSPDTDGYSGFEGTDLESLLRDRGITQVTVVGLATDYCVKNTALDALRAGLPGHRRLHRRPRRRGASEGDSERALAEVRAAGGVMA